MAFGYTFLEYVDLLKTFIRDKETYNRLLGFALENTSEELETYTMMGISQVNLIPPSFMTNYDDTNVQRCPAPSLIIMEATWFALVSNGIVQARNDLSYNNGGITVRVDDGQRYNAQIQQLAQNLANSRVMFEKYKISLNANSLLNGSGSGVSSPYAYLDVYRRQYII